VTGTSWRERYGISLEKQSLQFAAAHFLLFADGSREELHGHNYRVAVELEGPLDAAGLVADFLVVKPLLGSLLARLDHRMLVPQASPHLEIRPGAASWEIRHGSDLIVLPARDVAALPIDNTSSELLAGYLVRELAASLAERLPGLLPSRLRLTVEEAPGQAAWCELGPGLTEETR
jgi:6-pyruvoyltetrahydropterin/6-carboxytetrahydropterin synthase